MGLRYTGSDPDYEQNYGAARLYKGMGIDAALKEVPPPEDSRDLTPGQVGARTASQAMGAGGTIGQTLTGAGSAMLLHGAAGKVPMTDKAVTAGSGALAAGILFSVAEADQQKQAAEEKALVEEAINRKNAVQNAIAGQMNAARLLGVT